MTPTTQSPLDAAERTFEAVVHTAVKNDVCVACAANTCAAIRTAADALAAERVKAALLDFGEFCHEQYLGCNSNIASPTEYEYAYSNEVVLMAEAYLAAIEAKKPTS